MSFPGQNNWSLFSQWSTWQLLTDDFFLIKTLFPSFVCILLKSQQLKQFLKMILSLRAGKSADSSILRIGTLFLHMYFFAYIQCINL